MSVLTVTAKKEQHCLSFPCGKGQGHLPVTCVTTTVTLWIKGRARHLGHRGGTNSCLPLQSVPRKYKHNLPLEKKNTEETKKEKMERKQIYVGWVSPVILKSCRAQR